MDTLKGLTSQFALFLWFCFSVSALQAQSPLIQPEIEKKVDSVLSLMTLEEKVGQLNQYSGFHQFTGPAPEGDYAKERMEVLKSGGVGSMLNVYGAKETYEAQRIVVENSRLKIPLLIGYDVIHGYKTIFPIPLGEAASWDLEAVEKSARIAAIEASAAGINWTFAPMVDVSRDPRWGRIMEGSGEDPYLGSQMAVARVKGFQTDDLSSDNSIAATAKHFAGYGFSEAGRDYNTVDISKQTLLNVVFPPFKAASDAGVASVMNSFNDLFGVPVSGSEYLQRTVLKDRWGFNGFIVSDWGSIRQMIPHKYTKDLKEAAEVAINTGNDMDMESQAYHQYLVDLVKEGKVEENTVDEAVRRILRIKFHLGLFDDPYRYSDEKREKERTYTKEHREAARDVARKSIVLLKNEGELLPLDAKKKNTLAVIGTLAKDKDTPIAGWRGQGESNSAVSLLEGIEDAVGRRVKVKYAQGYTLAEGERRFAMELNFPEDDGSGFDEAIKLAEESDMVIMAIGEEGFQSGEGRSQVDVSMKGRQMELLKKVYEVNKNLVVVLMNGRPLVEPWLYDNIPAIVEAWHLGSEAGNAIADVLFGAYNPSGKLPVGIPRHVGQVPVYYNHKSTGRPEPQQGDYGTVFWSHYTDEKNTPQYPFGYGLSYTSFEYAEPQLSAETMAMDESVTLSVSITNSGEMSGEEVVQFYINDHFSKPIRPVQELKGFQKIKLDAGETKTVSFTITKETLGFYNDEEEFVTQPGMFTFMVGTSSADVKSIDFELMN